MEGADTYRLAIKPDDMPEDAYQRFCETAIGDDAWIDTPYNCMSRELLRSNTMNREQRKARSSRRNGDNMHLIIHR